MNKKTDSECNGQYVQHLWKYFQNQSKLRLPIFAIWFYKTHINIKISYPETGAGSAGPSKPEAVLSRLMGVLPSVIKVEDRPRD